MFHVDGWLAVAGTALKCIDPIRRCRVFCHSRLPSWHSIAYQSGCNGQILISIWLEPCLHILNINHRGRHAKLFWWAKYLSPISSHPSLLFLPLPFFPFPFPFPSFPLEVDPLSTEYRYRGMGSAVSSPSAVWGGVPAESEFSASHDIKLQYKWQYVNLTKILLLLLKFQHAYHIKRFDLSRVYRVYF